MTDRQPIGDEIRAALRQLDGSAASAVALLTDLTPLDLDRFGGLPDPPFDQHADEE